MSGKEPARAKTSVFFYLPNIVGYARVLLLLLAIPTDSNRKFAYLYASSYLLDALDGYLARALGQSSSFGAIFDMATDRASTLILIIRVTSMSGSALVRSFFSLIAALDVFSHLFCVVVSAQTKKSHKSYGRESLFSSILNLYYNRPTLFAVCFFTEVFIGTFLFISPLRFKSSLPLLLIFASFPFFLFKQLTNVLQIVESSRALSSLQQQ